MSFSTKLSLAMVLLIVWACGFSTEKRRPKRIEDTQEKREVKRVSEADIINRTRKLGDSITKQAASVFMSKISQQYAEGGYKAAAKFCSMQAYPLTDSLANEYKVFLKRVSNKNRNPKNIPSVIEKQVLEAYEYSVKQGDDIAANVQFIRPGDTILYNNPIKIPSELCLNCHGSSSQISKEVQAILKQEYPNDKAIGYKVGDLRGMWSLKFLKKEIVQGL
ncbi:hypothetical protein MATR_37730 [Marivirga tractuosa]|uniref:Tll0287-like domain-containing protein n=1 Tax=Marivirga tractuosa (strain ATCC 23168 / DSM 4126 / NBRC 15989 / NCIMB 1408 / VKM B-1430 / H-43) TaxID=643867 RepID=E4TMC2_MARTH|nr:DUF3365 domain-containing protein [Marivirga tractuosa]ADR22381.1 conserved hypothetical protein [Marivirga tractuosa DSM 4126]BDD16948.1 hypothetical protein MATR_37730 [Marivirga tractuosa]